MGLEADKSAREAALASARPLPPPRPEPPREPVLIADTVDAADRLGTAEAVRPLIELCLSPDAQTPFMIGVVGGPGTGKSFALRRLILGIEALASAAAKAAAPAFLSRVVVASVDGASVSGDPGGALAAAAFVALERERAGVSYAGFADEAAHATSDPRQAATAAAERHDELSRRLERERAARDDVESKRARLPETLLYETPGSRVNAFIRTSRASIEASLRRFGLGDNDPSQNFRDLVRDLSSLGFGSRASVALRAMTVYRGQTRLIVSAVVAFVLAFLIDRLRQPSADAALRGFGEASNTAADWLKAHADALAYAVDALVVLGLAALLLNVWRAVGFSSRLFRGLRLLDMDIGERRRELDASAARLARRVAGLQAEADAASQRAEAMARRAGASAPVLVRAPGPAFLTSLETPAKTARDFFDALGRLMAAAGPDASAPQRLVLAIDNLEAMAPTQAARLLETASRFAVPGVVVIAACDPTAVSASGRAFARNLFQVEFEAGLPGDFDGERFAGQMFSTPSAPVSLPADIDATHAPIAEPLAASETALLGALAPLLAPGPKALKRFHNAYRLARLSPCPRAAVALALAALQARDAKLAPRLREAILSDGETLDDLEIPVELSAALQSARAADAVPIAKRDALAGWRAARRFAPWEG